MLISRKTLLFGLILILFLAPFPFGSVEPKLRAVLEAAGVQDVLTKCLGSTNPHNAVKATFIALTSLRRAKDVAKERGVSVTELLGIPKRDDQVEPEGAAAPAEATASESGESSDG